MEERILLHLSNYRRIYLDFNIPGELTQEGIKNAVGTSSGYTSSSLRKLIHEGYVQENTGRVKGGKKTKRFFTLTPEGKEYKDRIRRELSARQISVELSDGTMEIVPFNNVTNYLEINGICPDITELDVLKGSTKDGVLDTEQLKRLKERQFVDLSSEAPEIMHFYGRNGEMTLLEKWLNENEKHNIIIIHGMAGIGKTTLAARICENHRRTKHLFWYNVHNLDTVKGVLLDISDFLCKIGNDHLELYLRTHRGIDIPEVVRILKKSISHINAIMVFDDFQKTDDVIRDFFQYFVRMMGLYSISKMIIISREIIPFYDRKDVVSRQIVGELKLEGLDYESSKEILKEKSIQKKKYRDVFEHTGGNPLFLELFDSRYQIDRYLHDELFSNLKKDERDTLKTLSTYRLAVPEEALLLHEDFDFEMLFNLFQKSIVRKDAHNKFFVHDLIKQFYYSKLSSIKRKRYHLIAAQWYKNSKECIDLVEAMYHYLEAREYKRMAEFAIAESKSILDRGYANELLAMLHKMDGKCIDTNIWGELILIKGKAHHMIGEWEKALSFFNQSADIATMVGNNELKVKAFCESGNILEEQNELDKAMDYFRKCHKISKMINYELGIALGFRGLGRLYWRKSRPTEAIRDLKKSIEIFKSVRNNDLLAATLVDMGNILDERYKVKEAIETYTKALTILDSINNKRGKIRVFLNIAVTYRHMEKWKEAIEYYKNALALAQELHEIKWMGYANAGLSYCDVKIDNYNDARKYVKKADIIAKKIDNENIMYDVNKTYAFIYRKEKKWDEAIKHFQKSIDIVKNLDALFYLVESHYEVGLMFEEHGDLKNAKKHFNTADELHKKLGVDKRNIIISEKENG